MTPADRWDAAQHELAAVGILSSQVVSPADLDRAREWTRLATSQRLGEIAEALRGLGEAVGRRESDDDEGPTTEIPNRLLALLVGADNCEHAADFCCHDCMNKAMDRGLGFLEASSFRDESGGAA